MSFSILLAGWITCQYLDIETYRWASICILAANIVIGPGGVSLEVQWLRLHAPNAGRLGLIPGKETRSQMLQLKIPHAATKI